MSSHGVASGMDEKAHQKTYSGFIGLMKWGTVAAIIVAAVVVYILVN